MEGTVTISIREYERLKDLPHVMIEENKKLKNKIELLESNMPKVMLVYDYWRNVDYFNDVSPVRVDYKNMDEFVSEYVEKHRKEIGKLIRDINDKKATIAILEDELNQPKEKKKKFWLF